jgi:hypothetical protein
MDDGVRRVCKTPRDSLRAMRRVHDGTNPS